MSPKDLNAYDILESKTVKLEFEGGVTVGVKLSLDQETEGRNYFDTF
jgi:hypothetical protein